MLNKHLLIEGFYFLFILPADKPVSKSEPLNPQAGMIIASPAANAVSGSEASQPQVSATLTEDSSTRDKPLTGWT